MAIMKTELYSSLWQSCDELRGGMDASQYKDNVLVPLFVKYVSDKYADPPYAPINILKGASFKDMVVLKGKSDIGDQVNKPIIAPLQEANSLSDMPDFNDATKLGRGKALFIKASAEYRSGRAQNFLEPSTSRRWSMDTSGGEHNTSASMAATIKKRRLKRLQRQPIDQVGNHAQ